MGSQRLINPFGVMQGRLLPKYQGRYQAHPVGYWQDEFPIAAGLGLDCIEFILDYNDAQNNPLMTTDGIQEIQTVSEQTGVRVISVCADYFMRKPLHSDDEQIAVKSTEVLIKLLKDAGGLGIKDIVIPCVDQSSIQDKKVRHRFQEMISGLVSVAEQYEVNLALETDLNPTQFEKLLTFLDSPRITVNYDIGNSASFGYDFNEELSVYGDRISDIHIKDRTLNGGSVSLGTGNANVPGFFKFFEKYNYKGPFIMQAYRDDEGIKIFEEQLAWLINNTGNII